MLTTGFAPPLLHTMANIFIESLLEGFSVGYHPYCCAVS